MHFAISTSSSGFYWCASKVFAISSWLFRLSIRVWFSSEGSFYSRV